MTSVAVDPSVLLASFYREPDWEIYHSLMLDNEALISAAGFVELGRVMTGRLREAGLEHFRSLVADYQLRVVPVDAAQAHPTVEAAVRYGKGHGASPAVLNYGVLFSYALAKALDLPLLYKGRDFAATDVRPVLAGA